MTFFEKVTGSDMTKEFKAFDARAKKLPSDYQTAWEEIKTYSWHHSDFSGRNLIPILDGILGLLEETSADGQPIREVLGDDSNEFCSSLFDGEGTQSYRDKWRKQLNHTITKKLGRDRESE